MKKFLPFILAIVFVVAMAVPAFAFEIQGLEVPEPYGDNSSYFAFVDTAINDSPSGRVLVFDCLPNEYYIESDFVRTDDEHGNLNYFSIQFNDFTNVSEYKWVDGSWKFVTEYKQLLGKNYSGLYVNDLVYSSVSIYTPDGHLVFQAAQTPLNQVIQTALDSEAVKLSQTMMIITLCGVGCLALLILLPTLKKILPHFLKK